MTDNLSRAERSRVMSRVKSVDTMPEMPIRNIIWECQVQLICGNEGCHELRKFLRARSRCPKS